MWSTSELGRRFQMTPQSMNEVVASLERKELIVRSKSAYHGRILDIHLTAKGVRKLETCDREADKFEREAFAQFSSGSVDSFRDHLNAALANLNPPRENKKQSRVPRKTNGSTITAR